LKLAQAKNVHLIGIGGIGMSALAKWLHWRQIKVSGSDITDSEVVASLPREITVFQARLRRLSIARLLARKIQNEPSPE